MFSVPGVQPFRFRMKVTTQFRNFKRAYMRMTGVKECVIQYRGMKVNDSDTPDELGMDNGFQIDVIET